ncbi:unnamed protein product, partial [Iphiclides podalirius]
MIFFRITHVIVFLLVFKSLRCERRIHNGTTLKTNKKYLVYFVKSEKSQKAYSGWTCGGALVTPQFIITAAACVEDVHYLYAIAGYKTHVQTEDLESNGCTKELKKKVVYTCVPKAYDFDYAAVGKWSAIDIALAKVDSPYLNPSSYEEKCSYAPEPIMINYEPKYQLPGVDAIVMGWGHLERWRQPGDNQSYLQKEAHYAATQILNKAKCKELYADFPDLQAIIEKYMICTKESGNLDDQGNMISTLKPTADGCSNENPNCRRMETFNRTSHFNTTDDINGRRHGICQNDHGGPLVTWVGGHEVLIGVASVFRVNRDSKCEGPYLFTSTQCNAAFIYCVLNPDQRRKGSICEQPPKKRGFDFIENYITWDKHADVSPHKEKVKIRPQIPISHFG